MQKSDFLLIGAGVVGLTIAMELKTRFKHQSIIVIEKEPELGLHSSGRNSGVLHSGIYYPPDTLKAKVCKQGAIEMGEFHDQNNLPLNRLGKVLVAANKHDASQLDVLEERARANRIEAERIDEKQLKSIEPEARSATGDAIWVPSTAVGSPKEVIRTLYSQAQQLGIEFHFNRNICSVDHKKKLVMTESGKKYEYGHVVNSAGLYADKIAHLFAVGKQYTMLPFKGIYWKLDPKSGLNFNHLIYPVPDLRVPFLGVHTTNTVDGDTYLGPTAVPAFGRENYIGINGVRPLEAIHFSSLLLQQFIKNNDGFRQLSLQEGPRFFKKWFAEAAKAIVPNIEPRFLNPSKKVGMRAQLLDTKTGLLVNDFLVKNGDNSTHVLNAISPAWTSAFPFARYVCDHHIN